MPSPIEFCYKKIAPTGGDIYYSIRCLTKAQRDAVVILYAFVYSVEQALYECSDPQVAQQKLEWWLKELAHAYQEKAQHPVGQALQDVLKKFTIPQKFLIEMVMAFAKRIQHAHYTSFSELIEQHYRAVSSLPLLIHLVTNQQDKTSLQAAHDLGISLTLIDMIQNARQDLRKGWLYFAEDDLKKFNVNESSLLNYQSTEASEHLFKHYADTAREYYVKAISKETVRANKILGAIKLATLNEIENAGFPVLTKHISLTPLRKLWILWRTR